MFCRVQGEGITVDEQGGGVSVAGGGVGGHAGVGARVVWGQGLYAERAGVLPVLLDIDVPIQRPLVLAPLDVQGQIPLGDETLHAYTVPHVQVRQERERGDTRRN